MYVQDINERTVCVVPLVHTGHLAFSVKLSTTNPFAGILPYCGCTIPVEFTYVNQQKMIQNMEITYVNQKEFT